MGDFNSNKTFGEQLFEFAQTVDIFTKSHFKDLKRIVENYLIKNFEIKVMGHLIEDLRWSDDQKPVPALRVTKWMYGGEGWAHPIKRPDGSYWGHVSYAYDKKTDLWIISGDDKDVEIKMGGKYMNVLNPEVSEELPNFVPSDDNLIIKTSVINPIYSKDKANKPIGVINFESSRRLRTTRSLKKELKYIANSVGLLHEVKKLYDITSDGTTSALNRLGDFSDIPFRGGERRVFFAYPHKCEKEVVRTVKRVFKKKKFEVKNVILETWEDIHEGNIMDEIWTKIETCQAGICYFSEIIPSKHKNNQEKNNGQEEFDYRDNPNVLYEAGMMHTLVKTRKELFKKLLLLREKNSPHLPFDIQSIFHLIVERDSQKVMSEDMINKIEKIVSNLVEKTFDISLET